MKKTLILIPAVLVLLAGCQQAQDLQQSAQKTINDASQQVENVKTQALETKAKIDEKVTQAQQASDAINKLTR
jgi:nitrous oxide reductase accessory protein NosL